LRIGDILFYFITKKLPSHKNITLNQAIFRDYCNPNKIHFFVLTVILLSSLGCYKHQLEEPYYPKGSAQYIHIAHTRTNENLIVDPELDHIAFHAYDMVWLGGDMAIQTSVNDETMALYDALFDLDNPNTLWALGNHDYNDLERVSNFTGREAFYTHYKNGICFLVLDTQDSLSNIVQDQKSLVDQVLDTLEASTHLVILSHKLIWMYDNPALEPLIPQVSNGSFGNCFFCLNPNNFNRDIYPRLIALRNRGVEVICIGGDLGYQTTQFEWKSPEGILFLASGINYGGDNNQALVFEHDLEANMLTWDFLPLKDL
jgi:hypothetical protein